VCLWKEKYLRAQMVFGSEIIRKIVRNFAKLSDSYAVRCGVFFCYGSWCEAKDSVSI
jgi:hypothetical protein